MRILIGAMMAAALAACATAVPSIGGGGDLGPSPFPVARGSALPPPAPAAGQTAPPEGAAAGGINFGQWRAADPATYAPALQSQISARYQGRTTPQIQADLEANGFACEDSQRLDCRIEIMERDCAIDWYVVVERARPEPIAGFDRMCLGAR